MAKDAELFVRAITYTVTFPATILGVLFRPRRVLSTEHEDSRCPPGVALGLALAAWFLGNRTLLRIETGDMTIPLQPASDDIVKLVVGTAAVVLIQTLVLAGLLRTKWDWRSSAAYLAYPIAATLFLLAIFDVVSVYFPDQIRAVVQSLVRVECRADKLIGDCSSLMSVEAGTFSLQVNYLEAAIPWVVYPWTLFNVIRATLAVPAKKGIWMSIVALVVLVGALVSVNLLVPDFARRTQQLADQQRTQQRIFATPDQAK